MNTWLSWRYISAAQILQENIRPTMSGARNNGSGPPQGVAKVQNVKLVLLGDQGVGKSSVALRFVRGEFMENSEATVGAAFLTQVVNISTHSIKFDIWDTAGQERYHSLAPMYYRGAQAAVVVYDITSQKSFARAVSWIKELRQQANSQIVILLAGNKADRAADHRKVSKEEGRTLAEENNLIFTECSAKTGMSVGEIFMSIAQTMARHGVPSPEKDAAKSVKLDKNTGKKGCC